MTPAVPSHVDPEELQAILGNRAARTAEVAARDFRRPLRFSERRRADVRAAVDKHVHDIAAQLAPLFPGGCEVELVGVHETRADLPLVEGEGPLAALDFRVNRQPAWVIWDTTAAVAAVERVVGSNAPVAEARRLTDIEAIVLARILLPFANHVAEACGARAEEPSVAREVLELTPWDAVEGTPDPHRLEVELSVQAQAEASTISVYVPAPPEGDRRKPAAASDGKVPAHLLGVDVELCARLAGCEVSLAQLLELEEGDVIPIDARVGDPAVVTVEGRPFARGQLGSHRGQLAIRIEHLEGRTEP